MDACLQWFRRELDPAGRGSKRLDTMIEQNGRPQNSPQIDLRAYIGQDLTWASETRFRDISFSAQRVVLFIRAIIKKPDLIILDEAFSGMDEATRLKCMLFLAYGESMWLDEPGNEDIVLRSEVHTLLEDENYIRVHGIEPRQALLCVSHRMEEVPPVIDRWICLPEPNTDKAVRFGKLDSRSSSFSQGRWWNEVWEGGEASGEAG